MHTPCFYLDRKIFGWSTAGDCVHVNRAERRVIRPEYDLLSHHMHVSVIDPFIAADSGRSSIDGGPRRAYAGGLLGAHLCHVRFEARVLRMQRLVQRLEIR